LERGSLLKGVLFGLVSLIFVSFQPIIAVSRPAIIDAYLFAATTCLIEAIIFAPLTIIERKKIKSSITTNASENIEKNILLHGWKKRKNLIFFAYIGINYAIAQILFFLAYQFGAINISLAQQTTMIFALLFGFFINHEKIKIIQIVFSVVLIFGLILAVTQGSFNLLELNIGVLIMLVTVVIWDIGHAFTKNFFGRKETTPTQFAFIRTALSGLILISTYFFFFPLENIKFFFDPINQFYFVIMGIFYGFDLLFWYKSLSYLDFSKAAVVVSPMPLLTALFATMILGETFTIFHLIGALIIISSIIMIVRQKKNKI
jgi:drug/metabolite transporter (DMT)-like permease